MLAGGEWEGWGSHLLPVDSEATTAQRRNNPRALEALSDGQHDQLLAKFFHTDDESYEQCATRPRISFHVFLLCPFAPFLLAVLRPSCASFVLRFVRPTPDRLVSVACFSYILKAILAYLFLMVGTSQGCELCSRQNSYCWLGMCKREFEFSGCENAKCNLIHMNVGSTA